MPNYVKVQIDVQKATPTTDVHGFRVYARYVPESNRTDNWNSFSYLGRTDYNGSFIWDRAIPGARYEFQIRAINSQLQEIYERPLTKTFTVDPPAPTSVSNIKVEVDE